jgi:pyruvate dehydrogenase E2 component (dihydrolipoamide acetyltransferase)
MPIVRKLAREQGIDLSTVDGTGPRGSVTRADLENALAGDSTVELVAMSTKRRAIAHHMSESWATIPHVTVQTDIRAERLLRVTEGNAAGRIPIEAAVAQAVLPLLTRYRAFNAVVRADSIEYRRSIHLGIAVDTADGLMVVVVRDADTLSLHELGAEIQRLAHAAQEGTLLPDEAIGQTFTISNIGALGGGHGTPIIPMGTSAILSIGRIHNAPVVETDTLAVGLVAPVDLSYDHRLIDGGLGQQFLSDLIENLESRGSVTTIRTS